MAAMSFIGDSSLQIIADLPGDLGHHPGQCVAVIWVACIRCELPHGFGRDYGTTSFWSGSCVALFHIEFPDFWDDQRDIVIGVFQKGGGIGSGS